MPTELLVAAGKTPGCGPLNGAAGFILPARRWTRRAHGSSLRTQPAAGPRPCRLLTRVRLRDSQARRPPPPRGPLGARLEAQARIAAAGADPPRRAGGRKRRGPTSGPSAGLGSPPRPRRARVPLVYRRGASGARGPGGRRWLWAARPRPRPRPRAPASSRGETPILGEFPGRDAPA